MKGVKDDIFLYLCKHGSGRGNRKQCQKKKRKPNFTTRELTIITENVKANKGILQSKFTDNVTNKTKTETWKAITEKVNAVGVANTAIYEVRRKWQGLFSTAKKEFSQQKKKKILCVRSVEKDEVSLYSIAALILKHEGKPSNVLIKLLNFFLDKAHVES